MRIWLLGGTKAPGLVLRRMYVCTVCMYAKYPEEEKKKKKKKKKRKEKKKEKLGREGGTQSHVSDSYSYLHVCIYRLTMYVGSLPFTSVGAGSRTCPTKSLETRLAVYNCNNNWTSKCLSLCMRHLSSHLASPSLLM